MTKLSILDICGGQQRSKYDFFVYKEGLEYVKV